LIAGVVAEYVKISALMNLGVVSRIRVAAWAFWALETTSTNAEHLFQHPDFTGLIRKEAAAALGLIEQNFKDVGDADPKRRRLVTVTPAVAVVLFLLSGVQTEVLSGFEAQEQTTALYAYRQQLLSCMEAFWRRRAESGESLRCVMITEEHLVRSLSKLSVVQVTNSILEQRPDATFTFPRLCDSAVWIHGPQSPFADVAAPYTLYRVKKCDSDKDKVTLVYVDELKQCGLLRDQTTADMGRILLLAQSVAWAGAFNDDRRDVNHVRSKNFEVTKQDRLDSLAYPENLLNFPSIRDDSLFVEIKEVEGIWKIVDGVESRDLPVRFLCCFDECKVDRTDANRRLEFDDNGGKFA
jgi:Cu/Ag efflux protein CusF